VYFLNQTVEFLVDLSELTSASERRELTDSSVVVFLRHPRANRHCQMSTTLERKNQYAATMPFKLFKAGQWAAMARFGNRMGSVLYFTVVPRTQPIASTIYLR